MDTPEMKTADHEEHDEYMPNAEPRRKMFSSLPVSEAQHTEDAKDGGMATVKAVGEAVSSKTGSLKKAPAKN